MNKKTETEYKTETGIEKATREVAEGGNSMAQFYLGRMYYNGVAVTKDDVEAVKWYRKAAEQGHADAQTNLGWMYDFGEGVAENDVEAVEWYRKAAEQGDAVAQKNLGRMYHNGKGVAEDDVEAAKWYRKAAEQGDAVAQKNLGLMYARGQGVPEDDVAAVRWLRKSADQGNATAQFNLGLMYDNAPKHHPPGVTGKEINWFLELKQELAALENWWGERSCDPDQRESVMRYAEGQRAALRLVYKTLFDKESGFSLREWVEMEGLDSVDWEKE